MSATAGDPLNVTAEDRVVATKPIPGAPREYAFPAFQRDHLANGITVLTVHVPGRPLVGASLVVPIGAADEPPSEAGATVLAARALTEGTDRHDAVGLIEAVERLGASLHADAGWDAFSVGVDVPASRLRQALELLAEVAATPTFPIAEVERIRDERLNDLLQARADPRRRVEEAFSGIVYTADSPYARSAGGTRETVERLGRDQLVAAWARVMDPARMTLIVAGDLIGLDAVGMAADLLGGWKASGAASSTAAIRARSAIHGRRTVIVDRPGAPQTEIRVGHVGLPRSIPDFHALAVMSAILGGLFNSRLNMKLREEKGYSYGAHAGYDLRRAAGPFAARAAVNTDVTAAALADLLGELERIREAPVTAQELAAARDYLVGVFPLRFETPGPIIGALHGMVVHGLPDDELATYRSRISAVGIDDVAAAARSHLDTENLAIVMVGDAAAISVQLAAAGLGSPEVVEDAEQSRAV